MHDRLEVHKAWEKKKLYFLIFKHKHGLKKINSRFANTEVGTDHQHSADAKTALSLYLRQCLLTKNKEIDNFL